MFLVLSDPPVGHLHDLGHADGGLLETREATV
jgi:hypothetical protein